MRKYESLLDFSSEWPVAMKAIDSHRKAKELVDGHDSWDFLEATVRRKHRGYSVHAPYSAFDSQVRSIVRLSVYVLEDEDSTISVSSKRNQVSEC